MHRFGWVLHRRKIIQNRTPADLGENVTHSIIEARVSKDHASGLILLRKVTTRMNITQIKVVAFKDRSVIALLNTNSRNITRMMMINQGEFTCVIDQIRVVLFVMAPIEERL